MNYIGNTKNGIKVFDKEIGSHNSIEIELLREGLQKIELTKEFDKFEINFDRDIGITKCVETSDSDIITYAKRKFRKTLTRFVLNRKGEATKYIVIILKSNAKDSAYIVTAYMGRSAEKEVGDLNIRGKEEEEKCKKFWEKHALVYDSFLSEIEV